MFAGIRTLRNIGQTVGALKETAVLLLGTLNAQTCTIQQFTHMALFKGN